MRVATSSSTRRLSGAATLPIAAQAQVRQSIPVIGYLDAGMQIPAHRGQSFRRIADSVPVIADSF